jgi:hypothetical protein
MTGPVDQNNPCACGCDCKKVVEGKSCDTCGGERPNENPPPIVRDDLGNIIPDRSGSAYEQKIARLPESEKVADDVAYRSLN